MTVGNHQLPLRKVWAWAWGNYIAYARCRILYAPVDASFPEVPLCPTKVLCSSFRPLDFVPDYGADGCLKVERLYGCRLVQLFGAAVVLRAVGIDVDDFLLVPSDVFATITARLAHGALLQITVPFDWMTPSQVP